MDSLEQPQNERGTAERLTARFAVLWAENRRLASLAEQRAALESSTAWAIAQRLAQWRQYLAPEGSWRQRYLRLCLRGFRFGRREETDTPTRSFSEGRLEMPAQPRSPSLTLRASTTTLPVSQGDKFRVAYIGSAFAVDAASMRYRAHNLVEALGLAGLESTFVSQEEILSQMDTILSHDLIVLVRRMRDDALTALIGSARRRGLPIVYDIDDYIFDPWVLPYVEAFHDPSNQAKFLRFMDEVGACLDQCDYFTGSTSYLVERAAALGKESFVIHNGLNSAQLLRSQQAREQRGARRDDGQVTRIGYFSGTRTHQADFRVVYPALMRLLREESATRLTIVGHMDVGAFPGLAVFMDRIDLLPTCHWSELPALIANVDINLVPLELTPFNEGKSNLKYFEAGLVEVPSIASPTRILCESIRHGHNGLLARTTEEWYDGLKQLVARPDWRRQIGRNALDHVLQSYAPAAIAAEAAAAYRQILHHHRTRRGVSKQTLRIVVLLADSQGKGSEILRRANELAAAGHAVTVLLWPGTTSDSVAALEKSIACRFSMTFFTVRSGGAIPNCDVLLALDPHTIDVAKANRRRARLTIADEGLLSTIQGAGRGLESLLRDWVQNGPIAVPFAEAA